MLALRNKLQQVGKILANVEKQFGQGTLIRIGAETSWPKVEHISTGSVGLNHALGVGGWPKGRLVEIFGPASSGKSTLALVAVRECQAQGGIAAYIDAEHALDLGYARSLGIRVEDVLLSQPDTEEQALEVVDILARSGAIDLVVLDSVAALVPSAEIDSEVGEQHPGLQARLMSQALRKLIGNIAKTGTVLLFLNQLRHDLNVTQGNPEVTPGGLALKFFSSIRVDLRCVDTQHIGQKEMSQRVRAKIVKNKLAPLCGEVEFDVCYGQGIRTVGEYLDWGVRYELIERSGSWYTYQNTILGQGRERACQGLQEKANLLRKLQDAVHEQMQQNSLQRLLEQDGAEQDGEENREETMDTSRS